MKQLEEWLNEQRIDEVECLLPDMNGIARGKILPKSKFVKGLKDYSLRMPESIFLQTVTGEYPDPEIDDVSTDQDPDVYLKPDADTARLVPWYDNPTAQVIHDAFDGEGKPIETYSRYILQKIVDLYDAKGWRPIVAPELEFFLVQINTDPDLPLLPPIGRSGRPETGRQSYGIDAANEFDSIFEDVYKYCEKSEIDIDTLTHEAGSAQMEINFNHGAPLYLADEAFLFKRTLRQASLKHNVYATFMAKPLAGQPGSAMHIHQSVVDKKTGRNLFADRKTGVDTPLFRSHVAGLQKYLPLVMPMYAPNVNSFRRLRPYSSAPINVHWGIDNRSCGLRVPISPPNARRIENRLAGADANPYLAIAASLLCGYLGMIERLKPTEQIEGSAYKFAYTLPRTPQDALHKFQNCRPIRNLLGERFVRALAIVKQTEIENYQNVISSWEREHLLLNV
ncbi:MAG TPA: glutamine synthetase family protein [Dongiaceae bacterium]|jgi:glutamine synthetase|nr:glutamine synthetase family protein [Dongiaceae bacterium]